MNSFGPLFSSELLLELIHEIPERSGVPLIQIARSIGRDRKLLAREMNPGDLGAKLGVVEFAQISAASGDFEPLDYIEQHLGRVAFKAPGAVSLQSLTKLAGQSSQELGDVLNQLLMDIADGRLDEPAELLKEVRDLEQVLAQLKAEVIRLSQTQGGE